MVEELTASQERLSSVVSRHIPVSVEIRQNEQTLVVKLYMRFCS
jgi:hypothetical protein